MAWPHVIGICPTYRRKQFLPRAVHMFLAQDYPGEATLYVYDDTPEGAWKPCCHGDGETRHIVYRYFDGPKRNCAEKRNAIVRDAIEFEDGDLVFALWDDDDHHGPSRLRRQVDALLATPSAEVCLFSRWLVYDPRRHLAAENKQLDLDGTAVFNRAHWDRAPWNEAIDAYSGNDRLTLQRSAPETIVRIAGEDDYVVVRHGGNATGEPSASYVGGAWKGGCRRSADELAAWLRTGAVCPAPR